MIVLDTTVLLYATGVDHPLRPPSRRLLRAISAGRIEATTTPEVIQEFAHIRARRTGRPDAVTGARYVSSVLDPLLLVDRAMLTLGLRLYEETSEIGSFDAVLCAAAITAGAEAIVSADRGFGSVRGITHLDPATDAFTSWLAASEPSLG